MTAIVMAASGLALPFTSGSVALDTTMTSLVEMSWFTDGTSDNYFAYGFNDSTQDPLTLSTAGSLGDITYDDGSSTEQTVSGVYYSEDTGLAASYDDSIWFGLQGNSIADTDTIFVSIEYNGITYTRASRTTRWVVTTVATYWQWQGVVNGPFSGNPTLIVNI